MIADETADIMGMEEDVEKVRNCCRALQEAGVGQNEPAHHSLPSHRTKIQGVVSFGI
jgi:hypothetical protein